MKSFKLLLILKIFLIFLPLVAIVENNPVPILTVCIIVFYSLSEIAAAFLLVNSNKKKVVKPVFTMSEKEVEKMYLNLKREREVENANNKAERKVQQKTIN